MHCNMKQSVVPDAWVGANWCPFTMEETNVEIIEV